MSCAAVWVLVLQLGACKRPKTEAVAVGQVEQREQTEEVLREAEDAAAAAEAERQSQERTRCAKAYSLPLFAPPDDLYSPHFRENRAMIMEASQECPPRAASEHGALAMAMGSDHLHDEALEEANRAVELAPEDTQARLIRGLVNVWRDAEEEAQIDLQRAIELDADNEIALLELGLSLKRQGEAKAAQLHFERTVRANPDYILGHYHLAKVLIAADDLANAMPHCDAVRAEVADAEMVLCSGLARARKGDLAGALVHLEETEGSSDVLGEKYEAEIERALRDAYVQAKQPLNAALHTCLEGDGIEDPKCEDREVKAAVAELRSAARARATEGSYASAVRVSARRFAVELAQQAEDVSALDALVHPEIGVFVFSSHGWTLTRERSWPVISAAEEDLTLERLRRIGKLPKRLGWETDELGCSYPLDGIGEVAQSEGLTSYHPTALGVSDTYRLCGHDEYVDGWGEIDEDGLVQLQRAALAVTHAVEFSQQTFEFGKIGDRWYLLAIAVTDPEDDACG